MKAVDFSSWIAGWTALGFVVFYGIVVIATNRRTVAMRRRVPYRIMVTGSRGKSGTVRLIHAATHKERPTYAKITGTAARELFVDGTENVTTRLGSTSFCEMTEAIRRAGKQGAQLGVFECMAVTPALINTVQESHVKAQMVVIPTIRLDHLEEEGLSIEEIAESIVSAATGADIIVTGVDQPSVEDVLRGWCEQQEIELMVVHPDENTPPIPGHHPTNVALALAIAEYMGIPRERALEGMKEVSVEPRALIAHRVTLADGFELSLIDLGSANDPQSAWEAVHSAGVPCDDAVPILVNRWERPLRSVSFFGSVRGRFPLIGIAGTLHSWMNSRHASRGFPGRLDHEPTTYFRLGMDLAKDPEKLARVIREGREFPHNRAIVVLVENVHDATADVLRHTFEARGQEIPAASVGGAT